MSRLLTVILTIAACCLAAAGAAHAALPPGPCIPEQPAGPICHYQLAQVTAVIDGDTIDVDLLEDDVAGTVRVRFTGIQAMEHTVYSQRRERRRGECHAVEATNRLEDLIHASNGIVRLVSQDTFSRSGRRARRAVEVFIDGRWQDTGRILLSEGLVLWLPNSNEWAWNRSYSQIAQQAARAGVGMWNTEYCAAGPPAAVKLWVHWDAEGDDSDNVSDEWVAIKNLDTAPLSLEGWWIRDSGLRRFTFPTGTFLAPGATLRVRVGSGPPPDLSWNLTQSIFNNVRANERAVGDGAYLFDLHGDLRAWQMYPCREACTNPDQGAIELEPKPYGPERILLRNVRDTPVDLEGYEVTVSDRTAYAFGPDSVLRPGETMRVLIGGSASTDTRLEKHWPRPDSVLRSNRGTLVLNTMDEITLACTAWGGARC